MRVRAIIVLVATLAGHVSAPSVFGQAPAPDAAAEQRAAAFVKTLAQALARRDRAAVADLVRYPANAIVGSLGIPIASRADLLRMYDGIFTAEVRCLVETSASGASSIRIESGGAMFADGRIRAEEVDGAFKIVRINVPPATGAAAPPPSQSQRVALRSGKAQYSGRLYGDGVDAYLLAAQPGNVVDVRIEGFAGRNASVRVVESKTGRALDRPGASAPRTWTGTIQQAGDYRIEVVRNAPYCAPSFTYLLTITVK